MLVFSLLQYDILIISVIIFSLADGHELCSNNVPVGHESNSSYWPFHHLSDIGELQCMKVCKRYKLCEKIRHNREHLTCDLMMTIAEPGNVTSLLDVESVQMDMHGCSNATCMENEVCINKHDGGHACLKQDICPTAEWIPFNHKCYLFRDDKITADANLEWCRMLNATMVRVDDDAVSEFLHSEMKRSGKTDIWIAANDRAVEGEWVWGPGDIITNAAWSPGEPNNVVDEDCAIFTPLLVDLVCSNTYYVNPVCEVPYNILA
ncbi:aggrecan core protein-like [Pecten maximus]|uniref:aggrecan core protein-like n=1 Tax=Pecten maximus TaxID=6579 RepID=UPI001458F139|nr:aggrecan core protein-like [Pecten maximus]